MLQWRRRTATIAVSWLFAWIALSVSAHSPAASMQARNVPVALAVRNQLGPPANGVLDLKFRDLFKLPVGPRGLEPSDTLRAADGKTVRIIGFMVQQDPPIRGGFLLSPLPVAAGEADEGLADDLPPTLIFVELGNDSALPIPPLHGLLQISGTLHLGAREEASDQRISFVQIIPDARTARALTRVADHGQTQRTP